MRTAIWFRDDLRTTDHPALSHATHLASNGVIAFYLLDKKMWQDHEVSACRVEFILRGLHALQLELHKLNIPLIVHEVKTIHTLPDELSQLLNQFKVNALFFNRQYEVNESRRDDAVIKLLAAQTIKCHLYDDQVMMPPGSVKTQQGEAFKVFTAFKHAWQRELLRNPDKMTLAAKPKKQPEMAIASSSIPTQLAEFKSSIDASLWPAGEVIAEKRLTNFIDRHLFDYDKFRDFPAKAGTSKLSPYLASGMISGRQCFKAAFTANKEEMETGNKGAVTWMNELIWREFYKHILVAVPRVSMNQPFKLETTKLIWKFDAMQNMAWQEGKTGFPIIDAAMRQLNQTGWMHNRLRMITAMFFTKNLFFDWHLGESYFMSHLIDGDLAANNGGWQWCASTGTDAAPYFRVFNPITQSERFDPAGEFIREFCPELAKLDDWAIHDPHGRAPGLANKAHYPLPLVDLSVTRKDAIAAFKDLK